MTDAEVARKLTHLKIQQGLGKLSPVGYRKLARGIGLQQTYSRETANLAEQMARSVVEYIEDYPALKYLMVGGVADVTLIGRGELHIIGLDFEADVDNAIELLAEHDALRDTARQQYNKLKSAYQIDMVARTAIFAKTRSAGTFRQIAHTI